PRPISFPYTTLFRSEIAGALSNAEKARQLRNNDMYCNARQEASYHYGVDSRFAIQPSLRIPPASSITPTSKASVVITGFLAGIRSEEHTSELQSLTN